MAITLINQATAATYPNDFSTGGASLGPSTLGYKLDVIVGNAPALLTIATVMDPRAGPGAGYQWTDDIPIVAGNGQIVQNTWLGAVGFKAKDLIPGTHASVYAVVWEKGDPDPTGAVSYAGTLSGSGITPGGASLTLIAAVGPLSSPQAAMTFTGIQPASFRELILFWELRSVIAGVSVSVNMTLNNDTGLHYDWQFMDVFNSAFSHNFQTAVGSAAVGVIPGSTAAANVFGSGTLVLPQPNQASALIQPFHSHGGHNGDKTITNSHIFQAAGEYNGSTGINQLSIFTSGTNFAVGSSAMLYGMS